MTDTATVHLLLVDDNAVDREGVVRALRRHRVANPVVEAVDGREALDILEGVGRTPLPRPHLVLLDLNMPRMNGLELLAALRDHPTLRDTVVFVLTTSRADEDVARAYARHIAGYIVKSDVGEGFLRLVGLLDHYWRVVELPRGRS